MKESSFSDQSIIEGIRAGGQSFEDMSMHLFNIHRGFIAKVNQKLHLSDEDIQDAYADGLVKLIRTIRDRSFKGDSKISSYFYSIFYNTAVDVSRRNASNKNAATQELTEWDAKEKDLLSIMDAKDEVAKIMGLMDLLGQPCQRILLDWAYYGYAMDEIAERSNLSGAESARSMKYKCLKKLKRLITDNLGSHV